MLVTETFHGYIETTQDVLLIFEGCRRGLLPRICRRLQEKERKMIQSGSVFVFDERESGIKRWTDGLVWSPSRILGNFLIYRELDKRATGKRGSLSSDTSRQRSFSVDNSNTSSSAAIAAATGGGAASVDRNRERQLVGSLSDSYKFRKDGLIKKTMSIVVNGVSQHLVSYYNPQDVLENRLRTPSSVPELASLEISPELLARQNFRIPPMVEPTFEGADAAITAAAAAAANLGGGGGGGGGGPISAAYAYGHRRDHPLRSMSLGSIRSTMDPYPNRHHENNVMYHYDNHNQKQQSPTISPYAHQPQPTMTMYGVPPAYPGIPSPSSLSSTPGTPMMSPVRAQHHQRHYSISSTSSISRVDTRDMLAYRPEHHQRSSDATASFSHLAGDIGFFDRSPHQQQQHNDPVEHHHPDNSKGTNIGQLLNPVHPLNSPTTTTTTTPSTATSSSSPNMFSQHHQTLPGSHLVTSASSSSTSSSSTSMAHPYQVNKDKDDLVDYRHHHDSGLSSTNYSVMHHTPPQTFPNAVIHPAFTTGHHDELTPAGHQDMTGPLMLK
ncbi:hypothetical protein K492DRAFT_164580 [Lichtheimia hyalospora FSU 10163]|nr:hypothetical protein K492DRAFT_164580 [Lichtheimia hyalospora FSU 10163]